MGEPYKTNQQKCISCGRCVVVCPEHARLFGGLLVNAALTAIDAGRLESAHRYLAKTSDSAERTLAEAAIAMLENRLDEAEALLGKLSDDPSVASQVEENLRQIAAKREELAD